MSTIKMPYGMHKGKDLKDVPSDYLLFIYENHDPFGDIKTYIEDNMADIKKEAAKLKEEYLANKQG